MVAQRPVPLHSGSAEPGEYRRRQIAKTAVWPDRVVVFAPERHCLACMSQ